MNKIILVGRLSKDIELSVSQSGKKICKMDVAVSRRFDRSKTDYFHVVCFDKQAESCARNLFKGSLISLTGEMQNNNFKTSEGHNRDNWQIVTDEIHFLSDYGSASKNSSSAEEQSEAKEKPSSKMTLESVCDGDLPF